MSMVQGLMREETPVPKSKCPLHHPPTVPATLGLEFSMGVELMREETPVPKSKCPLQVSEGMA